MVKRKELLDRMARLALEFGFEFSKSPDVHGGSHDKWYVGGEAVIVPRHNEINELTAKRILRVWEALLDETARREEGHGQ
ncbi:hypothetical protein Sru01_36020 [Sphaerisporangium rufum]|uniref:Type II toxin-antitoxin system HicA family toxin n=1 Tax=Sphaerisporangium rufum TaxID=1381558 RepID=A0A919R7F1_9ACTN|nr:hypothetical protein [Sphaerisporangium rufum]GII78620.1 hypothetical protein Sru01_36020 [Sphaerisporangium rufum]